MNYKTSLLIISLFFAAYSCETDSKTTFKDVNVTNSSNNIVEINIPKAIGNSLITDNINAEIESLVIYSLQIGEEDFNENTSKSVDESITLFNNEYEKFVKDFPEMSPIWEAQIDGEVMYQSPEIISVSITSYINTGGAHGTLKISFLNFDATNGKRLKTNQLFKDMDAFKNIAIPYFIKALEDKDTSTSLDDFTLPYNIAYSEDGLILLYNIHEIAPYSTGIIEFSIPFKDIESYLVFNGSN